MVEPRTPWKFDPEELSERNTHGLTLQNLQKKIHTYETAVPLYFGWFLSPADSRSIYDRTMILFKNLYESCDLFKENFEEFSSMLNWGSAMNFYRYVLKSGGHRESVSCTVLQSTGTVKSWEV